MHASIRRLAAIMATDVVGYSSLMRNDEAGTLAALKSHREALFDPLIARHNGRIVKLMGDGALIEFASVVDAVNCAVAIQSAIHEGAVPEGPAIRLRIGINLGDIIIEGDDIYGDGVNIAARLEALAEPGGICISSLVNESVGGRSGTAFADGGKVAVKNISEPIQVWKWHPASTSDTPPAREPAAKVSSASQPPTQASIAVLAFDNLSGDPEQEYFSDGITEDLITDLSKIGGLMVIARNSSFAYKGKSPDIRTVGRELGVTSVLEGSIRRAANRVRINAQLIDATNGAHLWAERYDRDVTDIFAVQDEVTAAIVDALKVKFQPTAVRTGSGKPTANPEAHDLFLRGREALFDSNPSREKLAFSLDCFKRAIELDPDYAEPYVGLSHVYNREFQNKWIGEENAKELSAKYIEIALNKAPDLAYAHYMSGIVQFWNHDLEGASRAIHRARELNPNLVVAIAMGGLADIYNGKPLHAIADLERAIRLDPVMGGQYIHFIGTAYLIAGDYENAVAAFSERIRQVSNTDLSRGLLIATLGLVGRKDEARKVWRDLMRINPNYSFEEHIARLPFGNPDDRERIRQGFMMAEVDA